ncbi:MAG: DHH family phosphoesterase [Bacteroidia bacterium]|nr:DHH family phosphoesterase [Bacteroidia bacterium]
MTVNRFPEDKILRLDALLCGAGSVAIITHTHPDGDALGSTTALWHFLTASLGRKARILVPDAVAANLGFIVAEGSLTDFSASPAEAAECVASADLIVCLDLNSLSRSAGAEQAVRASKAPKILIDHHLSPACEDFDLVFSETEISSASELLYYILLALPEVGSAEKLPEEARRALMVGMTTDTNNFANSVFPTTLAMASSLLAAGVDRDDILANLYNRYGENRFRAMGAVLSDLMHITPEGVAYFIMDSDFLRKYEICEGDTEGFVNLPLGIDRVKMSVFLKEDDGYYRVSVRSKKGWSANMLARNHFNGGGHECAAGGRLYWPKDIADRKDAAEYLETVTARFMCNRKPEQ